MKNGAKWTAVLLALVISLMGMVAYTHNTFASRSKVELLDTKMDGLILNVRVMMAKQGLDWVESQ